jgi:hypothetical protein
VDGVTAAAEPPPAPAAPLLAQNAPNPFNPRTGIAFRLPEASRARLEVLDLAGRRVAILVDAALPAGSHEATWDGTDARGRRVGAGTYLYRLTAAGVSETRRMTLVK